MQFAVCASEVFFSPSHFTGKERDAESGNDYFEARYYNSVIGRFLSPDWSAKEDPVPYANLEDPQSLNLYAYVRNNPLTHVDADGHVDLDSAIVSLSTLAGGVAGTLVGGTVGAGAGSLALPGEGTIGGGYAGGVLGGTVGAALGHAIGNGIVHALNASSSNKNAPAPADSSAKGPVKAADAPGVTAGGQATDKHGNKIGPSGSTQQNKTKSNTREGANNKAKSEGSGTTEHKNPVDGGKPHFHPTGADGDKKPSSTHHEYPGN